jgi:peroxiredoxin Q/BCP
VDKRIAADYTNSGSWSALNDAKKSASGHSGFLGRKEGDMTEPLEEGAKAPDFSLPNEAGDMLSLASFKGKALVLYFYPKDDTSGCTAEAIDFNGQAMAFAAAGAAILGVSPDPAKSHAKFKAKHELSIPLASDEAKETLEAYGVWVEKSMYGRRYMGVERTTVLIKPDGTIARIWSKVKVPGHAADVLAAVKAL